MAISIACEGLHKSYERRVRKPGLLGAVRGLFTAERQTVPAVQELSFSIGQGERVGLIGENGAGKSTTLKMLTGILLPTSGRLEVLGLDPWRQRRQLAARIGVVFGQRPQLLWDIPVRETFTLLKTMYRVDDKLFQATYAEAVKRLELEPLLGVAVRKLSLGQRMRCDLAASLLHAPAIAFLDEPTIGLDVSVKEQVREYVVEMQRRFGTTLLLTTHDLKDITETCDRLLLLDRGRLLFDGSLRDFERKFATERRILLELDKPVAESSAAELSRALAPLGGELVEHHGHRVVVSYQREGAAPALTQCLLSLLPVSDIVLEKADIDSMVASIYRRGSAEAGAA
ncbi:MAG: sugar transporter ATP-binding protein [Polyangiaceae bacterium]|jgi:ABC-2 type transport system ATP-binding protein|nr:sugar transporter ATP-binding protein [Polyangiaceae bacterium]